MNVAPASQFGIDVELAHETAVLEATGSHCVAPIGPLVRGGALFDLEVLLVGDVAPSPPGTYCPTPVLARVHGPGRRRVGDTS